MSRPKKRKSRSSKFRKRIIKALVFTSLLAVSVAFLLGLSFYKTLTKSFASADSAYSFNLLNRDIYSFAYITVRDISKEPWEVAGIYVLFVDKTNKKLISYNVAPSYIIDIPGKFGEEEISKSVDLGKMLYGDLDGGINMLTIALSKIVGFEVSKYVVANSSIGSELSNIFIVGKINIYADIGVLGRFGSNIKTNLNLDEFLDIYKFIKNLSPENFIRRELKNPENIDAEIREISFDSHVALERTSITVLNGTNIDGVASFGARVVQNMGGRVVTLGNTRALYNDSIVISDEASSATVKSIVSFFHIEKVITKAQAENLNITENEIDRSDVIIILGFDIANTL